MSDFQHYTAAARQQQCNNYRNFNKLWHRVIAVSQPVTGLLQTGVPSIHAAIQDLICVRAYRDVPCTLCFRWGFGACVCGQAALGFGVPCASICARTLPHLLAFRDVPERPQ